MPYLLPDDTTPTQFKCITIMIPDDPQWESTFWGALTELCKWFNFDRDEAHNGTIVAHLWQEWIEAAMSCNTITGIRVLNSWLEVQYCNSSTWVRIKKIMTGGIRYVNGAIEYDFDGDDEYEVNEYLQFYNNTYNSGLPTPTDTLGLDNVCSGVTGMVKWLCERASVDMAHSAAVARGEELIYEAIADMVTLGLGDVTPIDPFADIMFALIQASYDAIIAQYNNTEFQEGITCSLYCLIKKSGQTDLTIGIYNQWKATFPNWPFPISPITSPNGLFQFGGLADQMEHLYNYRHIYRRFWLYAHDESGVCEPLCTDCDTCTDIVMNFKVDKFCSSPRTGSCAISGGPNWADWELGVGYKHMTCVTGTGPDGGQFQRIQVVIDLGSNTNITSVRWKWSGTISGGTTLLNQIYKWVMPSTFTLISDQPDVEGEYTWNGTQNLRYLLIIIEAQGTNGNNPVSTAVLEEVEIRTT